VRLQRSPPHGHSVCDTSHHSPACHFATAPALVQVEDEEDGQVYHPGGGVGDGDASRSRAVPHALLPLSVPLAIEVAAGVELLTHRTHAIMTAGRALPELQRGHNTHMHLWALVDSVLRIVQPRPGSMRGVKELRSVMTPSDVSELLQGGMPQLGHRFDLRPRMVRGLQPSWWGKELRTAPPPSHTQALAATRLDLMCVDHNTERISFGISANGASLLRTVGRLSCDGGCMQCEWRLLD